MLSLSLVGAADANGTDTVSNPSIISLKKLRISVLQGNMSTLRNRETARLHFPLDKLNNPLVVPAVLVTNREPPCVENRDPLADVVVVVVHVVYPLMPSGYGQPAFFGVSPLRYSPLRLPVRP